MDTLTLCKRMHNEKLRVGLIMVRMLLDRSIASEEAIPRWKAGLTMWHK